MMMMMMLAVADVWAAAVAEHLVAVAAAADAAPPPVTQNPSNYPSARTKRINKPLQQNCYWMNLSVRLVDTIAVPMIEIFQSSAVNVRRSWREWKSSTVDVNKRANQTSHHMIVS